MPLEHLNVIATATSLAKAKLEHHIETWQNCTQCGLCNHAKHRVLGKGTLPCDILFIGEGPGNTENLSGKPFVGKSGRILNDMVTRSISQLKRSHKITWNFTIAVTNIVACIPTDGREHSKGFVLRTPTDTEANTCLPRVTEFIRLANPKGLVCLGTTARTFVPRCLKEVYGTNPPSTINLYHPAYLARGKVESLEYKRWRRDFTSFLKQLYVKYHG